MANIVNHWIFCICVFGQYVAGYTDPGGSEKTQNIVGIAMAVLLTTVSLTSNLYGGAQLYRINLIRKCFLQSKLNSDDGFHNRYISLHESQSIDDGYPEWQQTIFRATGDSKYKGSYFWIIYSLLLTIVIFISTTYIHQQTLIKYIDTYRLDVSVGVMQVNLSSLPFITFQLAFIFFTIYSIYVGYKFSFGGRESKQAHKVVRQNKSQQ